VRVTPEYQVGADRTAVLIIDPQKAFGELVPVPDAPLALDNMRRLVDRWRGIGGMVFVSQHVFRSSKDVGRVGDFLPRIFDVLREGAPLSEFHDGLVEAADRVIRKTRFSAVRGTNLIQHLLEAGVSTVVVAGLTTPICVTATVDDLVMSDFQVVVVADACASQPMGSMSAQEAHEAAIARLGYIFAQVTTTEELLPNLGVAPSLAH
jgi:nicotinamidase-related amidase